MKIEEKKKQKKKTSKNNKGFTLIEIIGVVIIIGIISGIGAIAVQGYIANSKAKTYESYKKDLAGASKNLLIDCMTNNEEGCDIPDYGRDIKLSYNELVEKGYSKRLKDPEGEGYCDKSYVIAKNTSIEGVEIEYQVCLYCDKYKSEESGCQEVNISDTVPPTCGETKGESTTWTKENKVISVKCNDSGGSGCLKSEFSKSIGTEGEIIKESYITIEDNSGNKATCPVKAYVDKKAPTCKIEVDPSEDGWYKSGVEARITSIADEGSGVAAYGMGTSLINRDYNSKTSYKVTQGIVTVFGYVKDKVGNEGYCSKEIKVDNTKPTGTIYMGYEVYPKEDTTVTTTKMTIKNINKYEGIDGIRVHFNKIVYGKITWTAGGKIESKIFAGNTANIMIDETINTNQLVLNVSSMTPLFGSISAKDIDKVEILKQENETSIWTNKDVTVYVSARDTITGVSDYSFDNGVSFQTEKTKSYSDNTTGVVKIRDQVGNVSTGYSFKINKIDKVAPTVGFTNPKDGVWTNSNITFTVNATDDASGIEGYYYSYNASTNYIRDQKEMIFSAERQDVANIVVCDNAGNCTIKQTNIWIDKTSPSLTISNPTNGNWTNQPFSLTLTSSDGSGSGLNNYSYSYDNTNFTRYPGTATSSFKTTQFSAERNQLVYIKVCDNAGNCTISSSYIKIDKTSPSLTIKNPTNGNWTNQPFSLTLTGNDQNGSGIRDYAYKYTSTNYTTYANSAKTTFTTTEFSAERNEWAYLRVCDNAGNCSSGQTWIAIDITAPEIKNIEIPTFEQWDVYGNSLTVRRLDSSGTILGFSYSYVYCIQEADGNMGITPSFECSDNYTIKNCTYKISFSNSKDGTYGCLRTNYENPCLYTIEHIAEDHAGNKTSIKRYYAIDYPTNVDGSSTNLGCQVYR